MEVYGSGKNVLVITRRNGTNLVQLICDNELNGYYLHHRRSGKLVKYDYIADEINDAIAKYEEYYISIGGKQ